MLVVGKIMKKRRVGVEVHRCHLWKSEQLGVGNQEGGDHLVPCFWRRWICFS